jgi:hypothetical protein
MAKYSVTFTTRSASHLKAFPTDQQKCVWINIQFYCTLEINSLHNMAKNADKENIKVRRNDGQDTNLLWGGGKQWRLKLYKILWTHYTQNTEQIHSIASLPMNTKSDSSHATQQQALSNLTRLWNMIMCNNWPIGTIGHPWWRLWRYCQVISPAQTVLHLWMKHIISPGTICIYN